MSAHRAAAAAAVILAACASPQTRWSGKAYCEMSSREAAVPGHEKWVRTLLSGYDPQTRRVTTPALDCTGVRVTWDAPAMACFDGALAQTPLAPQPIGEADVVVSTVGDGLGLVWVITSRFATGDGVGPVALVEQKGSRFVVRALGALRAYTDGATLRLERIGGTPVVVAEGRLCGQGTDARCVRAARVMPLRGDRFSQGPLFSAQGACVAPAWFDLAREDDDAGPSGRRRTALATTLAFGPEALLVSERLVVRELDRAGAAASPRVVRAAQRERTVAVEDGRLVTTGRSVWADVANADP